MPVFIGMTLRRIDFSRAKLTGASFDDVSGMQHVKGRNTSCPDGRVSDNCYVDGVLRRLP